ncbi:MAG: metallophosphoesterase [Myxococcota bacterium]|nr:metallophosphoesterase [Myxococcota bacterium]
MRSALLVPLALLAVSAHAAPNPFGEEEKPRNWKEMTQKAKYQCPARTVTFESPDSITIGNLMVDRLGSRFVMKGASVQEGKLTIGVLGAIKDAAKDTRKNLDAFKAWFEAQGVDLIVANGDVVTDDFELQDVFNLLADFKKPILVFAGNSESRTTFNRTLVQMEKKHTNLINGNWVRQLDWGNYSLWTLPGYHDKRFIYGNPGCHYEKEHLIDIHRGVRAGKGRTHVLVTHGPPGGKGKVGLDMITDGKHVGDQGIFRLIQQVKIPFGIHGHILEAGGAVSTNYHRQVGEEGKPMKSAYFNVGSASGFPWSMNGGKAIRGMADILKLDGKMGTVLFKRFE